ncbi:MAG: phosphatidate cytidylyltransferase [bacterium]
MSNLVKRILAGAAGIPLILTACYYGGIIFFIFTAVVSSIALWEFHTMFEKKNFFPMKYTAIIFSILIMISLREMDDGEFVSILTSLIFTIVFSTIEIFRSEKRHPVNVMIELFGYLYITIPFALLASLNKPDHGFKINILIYIFILIWTCDTMAYFGGRIFGKHQLSAISPKKTWEGSAAGFFFTVIISLLIHIIFPDKLSLTDAVIFGIITGIFSQAGDLFESLIKRYCDVKDSSDIIPGHGGVLDRFDSLVFVAPVIYIYIMLRG